MPGAVPLFVVRRRRCSWETPQDIPAPFAAAFADRAAADAALPRMSRHFARTARPRGNPFYIDWLPWTGDHASYNARQTLAEVTALPGPVLRDWMLDAGFDDPYAPPAVEVAHDVQHWSAWWNLALVGKWEWSARSAPVQVVPPCPLTDDQLLRFWEAMDKFPFYEVAETTLAESPGPP